MEIFGHGEGEADLNDCRDYDQFVGEESYTQQEREWGECDWMNHFGDQAQFDSELRGARGHVRIGVDDGRIS